MIVPKYWAEASLRRRKQNRQFSVRRFGWSDVDQADAQRNAEARAHAAMERLLAGERVIRREQRRPYNGAEGVPIREEIIATHGDTVITRNSYGALCLNTPNVMFADIDFSVEPNKLVFGAAGVALVGAAIAIWSATDSTAYGVIALITGLLFWYGASSYLARIVSAMQGGPKQYAYKRLKHFIANHSDWRIRLYETPAGYRALALHRTFDPTEPAALDFFTAIGADSVYVRMCANQRCFRARVSPKPWRIGIAQHLKPRPGTWPIDPERMPDRIKWVRHYEELAEKYAACRFVETLGSGPVDPTADTVRELHDDYCRATRNLPLA